MAWRGPLVSLRPRVTPRCATLRHPLAIDALAACIYISSRRRRRRRKRRSNSGIGSSRIRSSGSRRRREETLSLAQGRARFHSSRPRFLPLAPLLFLFRRHPALSRGKTLSSPDTMVSIPYYYIKVLLLLLLLLLQSYSYSYSYYCCYYYNTSTQRYYYYYYC